ncbi:uncharacterized protein EDB91DRAFT_1056582 [Suillus paluster]|uniref:uncharacterized protein n=1 Tax=Suillus paluster TaxID=48578 RepID=UPI001B879B0E|nr:uncharacterized protein EDB91DRAFT_1056582 [Suillus paluster]KAG1734899.1 hypothetical protein EDB91DRAFT_1056582 [Suillus paluster]
MMHWMFVIDKSTNRATAPSPSPEPSLSTMTATNEVVPESETGHQPNFFGYLSDLSNDSDADIEDSDTNSDTN